MFFIDKCYEITYFPRSTEITMARKTMTLNLTDAEMAVLEELGEKKDFMML